MDPPPLPFRLADPARFGAGLSDVGLSDVEVESIVWDKTFASGGHFWDVVTAGMPIAAKLTAGLTEEQRADVLHVLDGMLRERSGGELGATRRSAVNVGIGMK